MSQRDVVKLRATKEILKSRDMDSLKAKYAVDHLMRIISNPTEPEIKMGDGFPHVRYIHMIKDGCLGFCGEKIPNYGPPEIYDGKRLGLFGTARGNLGGGKPDYVLFGVMYWGKRKQGVNHITLANRYKVPAIFLHQSSPYRNQPRPAEWGFYAPASV